MLAQSKQNVVGIKLIDLWIKSDVKRTRKKQTLR